MSKILILNSTVSNGRVLVAFSYPPLAHRYKEYLERPENAYDDKHEWGVIILQRQVVSIVLPPGITFESPSDSKDAVLVFEDETMAVNWEKKMILWEKTTKHEGPKRSISRSFTVGQLTEKLSLPGRTFPFHHMQLQFQQAPNPQRFGQFSDSFIRQFREAQN